MNRSLDFTACDLPCKNPCWRRLTEEELEWLETHPNRQAYLVNCAEESEEIDEKRKTTSC